MATKKPASKAKAPPLKIIEEGPALERHLAEEPLQPVYLVISAPPAPKANRSSTESPPTADPDALNAVTRIIELAALAGGDPSIDHVKVDYIDGDHLAVGIHNVIVGEARSVSLFGGRRVVSITHADTMEYGSARAGGRSRKRGSDLTVDPLERLVNGLPKGGPAPFVLIFVAERLKRNERAYKHLAAAGAVVTVAALNPIRLQRYLEESGTRFDIKVDRGVGQRIWDRLGGGDGARLRQTADRLLLDVGQGGHLNVRRVEDVVPMDREAAIWAITDAISSGDTARCLGVLHLLLQQGTAPLAMVGFLASHYRSAMQVLSMKGQGLDRAGVAAATGIHAFRVGKMMGQLYNVRPETIEMAIATLAEADTVLKSSNLGSDAGARWMEQVLLALTRGRPLRKVADRRAQASI